MIKTINRAIAASVGLLALAAGSAAQAASQGSFGATSTGSLSVSVSVPNRVRLSGLTDVAFTNQDPSVAASNAQNVCVWAIPRREAIMSLQAAAGPAARSSWPMPRSMSLIRWNGQRARALARAFR